MQDCEVTKDINLNKVELKSITHKATTDRWD